MLAHAFLAIATAIERKQAPAAQDVIELTVNEFRRLFDALLLDQRPSLTALLSWLSCVDDIKPAPAKATTDHKVNGNDHDLRL